MDIENKIVLVKWRDSVRSSDWEYLEDIDDNVLKCESIGFLIADTEEHITIAQNYGIKPEQVCNLMTIPKCCIDFFEKIEIE